MVENIENVENMTKNIKNQYHSEIISINVLMPVLYSSMQVSNINLEYN